MAVDVKAKGIRSNLHLTATFLPFLCMILCKKNSANGTWWDASALYFKQIGNQGQEEQGDGVGIEGKGLALTLSIQFLPR